MGFASSTAALSQSPTGILSLLFTDNQGQVVFADKNFARLSHRVEGGFGVRGPLHTVLGISKDSADQLLDAVRANGLHSGRAVQARTVSGALMPLWEMGVASYDDRAEYIGADLVISDTPNGPGSNLRLTSHTDVLTLQLQQTMADSRTRQNRTYIQVYMGAQFNALQVLLARMAGPVIRDTLEQMLLGYSVDQSWPITIRGGELEFTKSNAPFQVYGAFQQLTISYATGVLGRRVVAQELSILDRQLDPGTLQLVTELGLRMQQD